MLEMYKELLKRLMKITFAVFSFVFAFLLIMYTAIVIVDMAAGLGLDTDIRTWDLENMGILPLLLVAMLICLPVMYIPNYIRFFKLVRSQEDKKGDFTKQVRNSKLKLNPNRGFFKKIGLLYVSGDWLIFPGDVALRRKNIIDFDYEVTRFRRSKYQLVFHCKNTITRTVRVTTSPLSADKDIIRYWLDGNDMSALQSKEILQDPIDLRKKTPDELLQLFGQGRIEAHIYNKLIDSSRNKKKKK